MTLYKNLHSTYNESKLLCIRKYRGSQISNNYFKLIRDIHYFSLYKSNKTCFKFYCVMYSAQNLKICVSTINH